MNEQTREPGSLDKSGEMVSMKLEELTELLMILNREAKSFPDNTQTGKVYYWTVYKEVVDKINRVATEELRLATLEEHSVPSRFAPARTPHLQ